MEINRRFTFHIPRRRKIDIFVPNRPKKLFEESNVIRPRKQIFIFDAGIMPTWYMISPILHLGIDIVSPDYAIIDVFWGIRLYVVLPVFFLVYSYLPPHLSR